MVRGRRATVRSTVALVATLAISGCVPDEALMRTIRVDSAGIEIVTSPPGSTDAALRWELSPEPVADIGSTGDLTLFRVAAVAPLDGGQVVVGMTAPPQVIVVDGEGRQLANLGRSGEGPGEFAGVGSLVPLGDDSIAVWDPERRRVSVFDLNGALLREMDLRGIAPLSWIASPDVSSASARTRLLPSSPGSLWLFSVGVLGSGSGVFRPSAPSYRISTDGEVIAELGLFPGDELFNGEQFGTIPYPFGAMTHGSATGQFLVVGTGSSPELRLYGPDGDLVRLIRWPDPDQSIGGERLMIWDSFWEDHLASLPEAEARFRQEALETIPARLEFPAVGRVVVADSGDLWVGPYLPGQQELVKAYVGHVPIPEQRWLVFGAQGELMASVETPVGFMIHAIRSGRVWGVHRDELDVESVRAYDVQGS